MRSLEFEYLQPERIIGSDDFIFVKCFLDSTGRDQIGWHYIVDLTWIYGRLKHLLPGSRILDAGGGVGAAQFMLAELGFDVTNVDLYQGEPAAWIKKRYDIKPRLLPSFERTDYSNHIESLHGTGTIASIRNRLRTAPALAPITGFRHLRRHNGWRRKVGLGDKAVGQITWLRGNLAAIPELEDQSFDALVSLSAVEHFPVNLMILAIAEMRRALKPDATIAVTTSGTDSDEDWYHEPSKGQCFSAQGLKQIFGADAAAGQNAAAVQAQYQQSKYLRSHLADFYYRSGNNGMPWGKWDPQYIPVGIFDRANGR